MEHRETGDLLTRFEEVSESQSNLIHVVRKCDWNRISTGNLEDIGVSRVIGDGDNMRFQNPSLTADRIQQRPVVEVALIHPVILRNRMVGSGHWNSREYAQMKVALEERIRVWSERVNVRCPANRRLVHSNQRAEID